MAKLKSRWVAKKAPVLPGPYPEYFRGKDKVAAFAAARAAVGARKESLVAVFREGVGGKEHYLCSMRRSRSGAQRPACVKLRLAKRQAKRKR